MKFLLLLFFVAAIPLFECYRFVRESPYRYRYRVERSIPNDETYRFARSPGISGYRVAPAYRYRIHRSVDDDSSEVIAETPEKQLPISESNSPYRYRIIEAVNPPPKPASNETPPDCSSGDQKKQLLCLQAFFDKKSIQLSNSKLLPSFSYVYQNFYNDDYERNKQEYEDFVQCVNKKDISKKCFYFTNIKKLSKNPEDAKNYTEFFNTIDFLYKNPNTENGIHCETKDSVSCGIEKATNNCETFKKLVDCFMFLYDNEPCPTDFREDFCHLITTDLVKGEYIPSDCFTSIDLSCSNVPKINLNLLTLITVLLIRICLLFSS